ncbi:MAG: thioredoxin domain-containing protein [Thermodesulfobacteriota bacterium]
MNSESVIVPCAQCGTKNRLPKDRWGERAVCGKCRTPLPSSAPFPDHAVEVSDWTFQKEVLDFPGPVLLEFFAPWCGHCQKLSPVLDELTSEYAGRVKIAKLNVDQNTRTTSEYGIRGTPSLYFFKRGKLVDRVSGALPKGEIERRLMSIL